MHFNALVLLLVSIISSALASPGNPEYPATAGEVQRWPIIGFRELPHTNAELGVQTKRSDDDHGNGQGPNPEQPWGPDGPKEEQPWGPDH